MNRTNDGRRLDIDDFARIAIDAGIITADQLTALRAVHDKPNALRSHLNRITAEVRFSMFSRCELSLDTRS